MGSLGLPVQTSVLAGTDESSRPFRRAGDAQDALEVVAEADLEITLEESQTASHSSLQSQCKGFPSSWTEVREATLENTVLFRPAMSFC
jgi:hypothetical protein